ncbi:unnamed protein product [Spirodela intermedia]|uniref:Uncharacterized protein n=1 Tax=Spirodela intermedia TaxID=51605 RepID=A0A7I8JHC0_SPIIN|nr:unnamed protein product [Spirodela intermedia]CAA6669524.1 unnamed protein product [Spirodela intermedia]
MSSPKEGEVLVVPFHSKGHTFPAIELSHHLAARGLSVTLFLPSLPSSPLHDIVTVHQFAALHRRRRRTLRPPTATRLLPSATSPSGPRIRGVPLETIRRVSSLAVRDRGRDDEQLHPFTSRVAALLFNTCDAVERPFLEYIAKESGKPVWGVGPLLPSRFWSTADEPVGDEAARPEEQREFGVADGEIRAWLDAKPPASVVYISFGTLVGPADEELEELAAALEESRRPFIWVLQAGPMGPGGPPGGGGGYFPEDLARQAEESQRGLVIRGGPRSAGEGGPILAWPIKGDQVSNSKLVTARLRVGYPVRTASPDPGERVTRRDVTRGIERLMADDGVKERAAAVRSIFDAGFPRSSAGSLDAFVDFLGRNLEPLLSRDLDLSSNFSSRDNNTANDGDSEEFDSRRGRQGDSTRRTDRKLREESDAAAA